MKLAYLALILPLLGFSCAAPVEPKPHVEPGRYSKTLKVGEMQRSYILRVPKKYDNKTPMPLVVVFHGWTSSAEQAETYTRFADKSEKEGFILVVPNGTEGIGKLRGWNAGFLNLGNADADDVKFTEELLDATEKELHIDKKRIYIAGHSNGAMMAYTLGAKLSDRIAAIGVVAGTIGLPEKQVESPKGPVSAIIVHGKADETVPYDSTVQALIKSTSAPDSAKWWAEKLGCGPGVRAERESGNLLVDSFNGGKDGCAVELVTIVGGGHSWPSEKISATDLIWEFFQSHPKR